MGCSPTLSSNLPQITHPTSGIFNCNEVKAGRLCGDDDDDVHVGAELSRQSRERGGSSVQTPQQVPLVVIRRLPPKRPIGAGPSVYFAPQIDSSLHT